MGSFRHLLTIPVHWFRGKRIKKIFKKKTVYKLKNLNQSQKV